MKKIITFGISILVLMTLILSMLPKVCANFFEDGFVMPDIDVTKVLSSSDINNYDSIKLLTVKEEETYTERFGKTYKEDNEAINLDYPIFINNHTAMRFMNKTSYVIDTSFNYVRIVENTILSNQTYFNEDGIAVDTGEYMIVQLPNKLFVSADNITFSNLFTSEEFNKNSLYYFDENFVNIYEYDEGTYRFKTLRSLQNTTIKVGGLELQYSEFYEKLLKIKEIILSDIDEQAQIEEDIKDLIEEENHVVGKPSEAIKPDRPVNPDESPVRPPVIKPERPEMEYVKPEVYLDSLSSWVYTINGNITIKDPSSRILNGVVFYVYDEEGKLVLRQNVNKSGIFNLSILEPNKTFVVNAQFEYYNKNDLVATEVILENTVIHTLPMEGNIYPVEFNFEVSPYSKPFSMVVDHCELKNTTDYDENIESLENSYKNTLPYIHKITYMFEGDDGVISTNISNRALSKLKNREIISFETNEVLKPKTTYQYIVKAFDKFGNEIKLDSNTIGNYTTSKSSPIVRSSVVSSNHDTIELKIQLTDEDNALSADGFKMTLFDIEGQPLSFDYEYNGYLDNGSNIVLPKMNKTINIKIFNLPPLNRFEVKFIGDYDLENGEGLLCNQEIGNLSFLSGQLPTGTIHFDNEFHDIGDTYATMDLSLSKNSTAELLQLMNNVITSIEGENQEIEFSFSKQSLDAINIDANYDESRSALIIQNGSAVDSKPEILLIASKEALKSNGVWKTFLNSGLLGKQDKNAGYLQFNYLKNTLMYKTTYKFNMAASTNINGIKKDLNTEFTSTEFTTLSLEPIVTFHDFFLAHNFIELYDINAWDDGNTIIDKKYLIQLCESNQIINSYELKVGELKDVLRFDNLKAGKKYQLKFVAPQYQPSLNSDIIDHYVIKELNFTTDEGVSADFNIQSIRNGYDDIHNNKFVANITNIKYGTTFNVTTKVEEPDENSFITDYIPFNKGTYKAIQNFAAPGQKILIVYYKADKSFYTYNTLTPINGLVNDEYCLNNYNNGTISYMRIVGQTGYEKNARVYDLLMTDLQSIVDSTSSPDMFKDGVSPGTTGFDSVNPSRSTTDYIKINAGETLYFKANKTRYLYFYTEDHKFISSLGGTSSSQNNIVDVPANACYVRYSIENLNKDTDFAALYRIKDMVVKDYDATFNWTINDNGNDQFVLSNLLDTNQYFIRQYVSESMDVINYEEKYTKNYSFESKSDGSIAISMNQDETLPVNQSYRYEIIIRYHDRDIILDSFEIDTKSTIHLIRNSYDLKQIQYDSFGTFIALNDIVENEVYSVSANFGGKLDFQNYSLTLGEKNIYSFINCLNPTGVIENIQVIMDSSYDRIFVHENYGKISNINYTIRLDENEILKQPLVYHNIKDGIIENFVIQFNGDVTAYNSITTDRNSILVSINSGIIRNGYIYNTQKEGIINFISRKDFNSRSGILCGANNQYGIISNVYAEVNIASDYDQKQGDDGKSKSVGIISGANTGRVSNVFGLGTRYSFDYNYDTQKISNRRLSHYDDPMFGNVSTGRKSQGLENLIYNNVMFYDFKDNTYDENKMISSTFDIANLYDSYWYASNINSNDQFDVSYISQGYYPFVKNTNGGLVSGQTLSLLPKIKEYSAPHYLDYIVKDIQSDYVDVVFKFNNESKADISEITVENLTVSILEQKIVDDIYEVKVRLTNPKEFVSGYTFTQFTYRTLKGENIVKLKQNVILDVSFYKVLNTIEDWSTWLSNKSTAKMNYNYRLGNSLDFSGIDGTEFVSKYRVSTTFTGKLDGSGYAIQNINFNGHQPNVNSILFSTLSHAEMKNIEFKNISWNKTSTTQLDNAIIFNITNSTIDRVNLTNINITGTKRIAGLSVASSSSNYTNITANHIVLRNNYRKDTMYMGGLVAECNMINISNSYVNNIDIATNRVDLSYNIGVGGMVGYAGLGTRLQNVYTLGKIKTTSYAGGIAGNGTYSISQAYKDVYMETDGDYNAGIAGTIAADASVKNSFSVGNFIHSIKSPLHTNRIISSENYWYLNNNYGYVNQTFNNEIKDEKDSSALLTYEDFLNKKTYTDKILLSDHYDYEGVSKGVLPKLKDTDGNLLPYQPDHYLDSTSINVKTLYSEIETVGDSEFYIAKVQVRHAGYDIDSIVIDGMQIIDDYPIIEEVSKDSVHNYLIKSYKLKAYDKYNLKVNMHAKDNPDQTKELVLSVDYGRPLYWVIKDYPTWQAVMETHGYGSENIMISGNVDFSGKDNVYNNITANRLEGDPANKGTIKGYTLNGSANNSTLISTIYGNISNITFEEIHLQFNGTQAELYRNVGIVGIVQGEASYLNFINCSINDGNGNSFINSSSAANVSLLNTVGGDLHDIDMENISIQVNNKSISSNNIDAGLASVTYKSVYNIQARDIHVDAFNGFCVGGVIGYANPKSSDTVSVENIKLSTSMPIDDVNYKPNVIKGLHKVGGILGTNSNITILDLFAENVEVSGYESASYDNDGYIGGVVGAINGTFMNRDQSVPTIKNAKVTAKGFGRAGGVGGSLVIAKNLSSEDVVVESTYAAGGIVGINNSTVTDSSVKNASVKAKVGAGGVQGIGYNVTNCQVTNSAIEATQENAGGIIGAGSGYDIHGEMTSRYGCGINGSSVIDTTIKTPKAGGGLIGMAYTNASSATRNFVSKTNISVGSGGYAGGIIGKGDRYSVYVNIVNNNTVIENKGTYTGGIAGYLDYIDVTSVPYFNQNFSVGLIKGQDYTGGIVGYLDSNITTSNYYLSLYSDINMSNVQSNGSNVYGFGTISERGYSASKYKYHLVSYENATINGQKISDTQLSNLSNDSFRIVSMEELSDYTKMTSSISESNYNLSRDAWNNLLNCAVRLENFSISFKGFLNGDKQKYMFKIEGVRLNPGDYKLDVRNNLNGNPLFTYDISVDTNGVVKDKTNNSDLIITPKSISSSNAYMSIYRENNGTKQIFATSECRGINANLIYHQMIVDGAVSNYRVAKIREDNHLVANEFIKIEIDNPGNQSYKWFRLYKGNAYNINHINVTHLANGNILYTNLPGVYYAISDDGKHITELFRYDGVVYYPFVSSSLYIPYEQQEFIPLSEVYKNDFITKQEPEVFNFPTYTVYSSGVNTINVEFDSTIDMNNNKQFNIILNINGKDYSYPVSSRVMTFAYDYGQTDGIRIKLLDNNGITSTNTYHSNESLCQTISLDENKYYFIDIDGNISGGSTGEVEIISEGSFVHVYENQAMKSNNDSFTIVNLLTSQEYTPLPNGTLLENCVSLKEDNISIDDAIHEILYFRSFMYDKSTNKMYKEMIFNTLSGKASGYDGEFNRRGNGLVLDFIKEGEKDIPVSYVLDQNGQLLFVENEAKLPDKFSNKGISELAFNVNTMKSKYVMIKYPTKVLIWDYETGKVVLDHEVKNSSTFSWDGIKFYVDDYIHNFMSFMKVEGPQIEQNNYHLMIQELNKIPNSEMIDINRIAINGNVNINIHDSEIHSGNGFNDEGTVTEEGNAIHDGNIDGNIQGNTALDNFNNNVVSRDYIPIYNSVTKSYDIYTTREIVENKEPMSENEKVKEAIDKGYKLSDVNLIFNQTSKDYSKDLIKTQVILYLGIFTCIVGLLFILKDKIKRFKN